MRVGIIPKWNICRCHRVAPLYRVGMSAQLTMFNERPAQYNTNHKQLLKWVGNKQRFACEIASYFPAQFGTYFEPFIGSAAVMSVVKPARGIGSDSFAPLVELWQAVVDRPDDVKEWYRTRYRQMARAADRVSAYNEIRESYNKRANPADLLFLCRACYGGVVRFRKHDGYMSTPCGAHKPISPEAFATRVDDWHDRMRTCEFKLCDYSAAMVEAAPGDLIYCDPPYTHTQSILYGAQEFSLEKLLKSIAECKGRGVHVALSIDGRKRSGAVDCQLPIPDGLFEREVFIECGRSMLKRFQMDGATLEEECVADRLLLTY